MSLSVLMFCPQFRPLIGGAERQVEKLSTALVKRDVRVKVLTPKLDRKSPLFESVGGVEIVRFSMPLMHPPFGLRGAGPINRPLMRRSIRRAVMSAADGVDVVHGHIASRSTAEALEAARDLGLPTICKLAMAGCRSDFLEIRSERRGREVSERLLANTNRWIATTQAVMNDVIAEGVSADRIARIPNGVMVPSELRLKLGPCRRFLYLGRLSSNIDRDVPTLITAFDRLADTRPYVELAIVGGGDRLAETQSLAAGCRNADRIRVTGFEPPESWLDWADAFVLPSRREGLSNALLEAMAAGLACIANDILPNRETLDDGGAGLLVPLGDLGALQSALATLADDARNAERLRIAAYEGARARFAIETVAERCIALYQEIIEECAR